MTCLAHTTYENLRTHTSNTIHYSWHTYVCIFYYKYNICYIINMSFLKWDRQKLMIVAASRAKGKKKGSRVMSKGKLCLFYILFGRKTWPVVYMTWMTAHKFLYFYEFFLKIKKQGSKKKNF